MPYLTRRLNTIVLHSDDYHADAKKEGIAGVCGKGWVGTKGNCKRRSAKGKLTDKQKAGAQALADRIRAERGMKPRGQVKTKLKPGSKEAQSLADQNRAKRGMYGRGEHNRGRELESAMGEKNRAFTLNKKAKTAQLKQQAKERLEQNRKTGKANLPSDRPASSNTIVPKSGGLAARPTRKEQLNALAYQAGKLLGDRARADIEITRKAVEKSAPVVKKALMEGAKKAGQGFGAAARAVSNAKNKKRK